ncbi:ribbon-helix-helix protein, CopG family [Nocardia sp. NPDC019395]|uniref:CopG family ribbon-helix-helix protein n=1 Tax=Nocardia sp. NPDC019395 TaxID=3154686 RepID=UPI0033F6D5CC
MTTRQVSVSLTATTLNRLERLRHKMHRSRSEIIAEAVEEYVKRQEGPPPLPTFDMEPMDLPEQKRTMVESMQRRAGKR